MDGRPWAAEVAGVVEVALTPRQMTKRGEATDPELTGCFDGVGYAKTKSPNGSSIGSVRVGVFYDPIYVSLGRFEL